MPIGNQEIWDKGIGAGATNVIFGGGDTQPSATNFNPGALGADPNASPAATTATDTPAAPASPAISGSSPAMGGGPAGQPTAKKNPYQSQVDNYTQEMQKWQLLLQQANASGGKMNGLSTSQIQQKMFQAQQKILEFQNAGKKWM